MSGIVSRRVAFGPSVAPRSPAMLRWNRIAAPFRCCGERIGALSLPPTLPTVKLQTNIFLWVTLATTFPLALLVLGATLYSERQYEETVTAEVNGRLVILIAEIDRRLYDQRQMRRSLASDHATRALYPVLRAATAGELHPEFFTRAGRLTRFLESLQSVVPGFGTLRVVDFNANTLIKVHIGRGAITLQEGIESLPFAEEEPNDPDFARRLAQLPDGEVSFITLPDDRLEGAGEAFRPPALLTAVLPLEEEGERLGYLMGDLSGDPIDHLLETSPRLLTGDLIIAEINPENPVRHGLVLYDDASGSRLSAPDAEPIEIQSRWPVLLEAVEKRPYGMLQVDGGRRRLFYQEYLPYPGRLVSWVVAMTVESESLRAPFNRIRMAGMLFVLVAVVLGLLLARMGSRSVARPIRELATTMEAYGAGDHSARVEERGGEEIRTLAHAFNHMADTLDHAQRVMVENAKLASLGEMAAGIGHELNNPLNNILSLVRLMERQMPEDADRLRRDLEAIRDESLRASRIIRSVLNFARQVPPEVRPFELDPWLEETAGLLLQAARDRQVELARVGERREGCVVEGDRSQLQQALVNLLLNAIQATPAGGRVELSLRCDEEWVELRVRDFGSGIAPDAEGRLFDPFFTTKGEGEGAGLGLSISLGIVERHRGTLTVHNHPEGGVEAVIRLPRHAADGA